MNLRIPGPTPLPPQVLAALNRPMIDHRGPEFAIIQRRIVEGLKTCCQTRNDLLIYAASGTGGLEAALANTLSPGDYVLALCSGAFGDRFAEMARAFGVQVQKVDVPLGSAVEPDQVRAALQSSHGVRAVLVTHNETSTGILNPLEAIARTVRENSDALIIVDAVSSLAATEVQTDKWGIDVLVSASQKAWMAPPGLAMLTVSDRAWKAHANARLPRFYWDWTETKKWMDKGQTPFTPAISVYFALDAALTLILGETLAGVFERHIRLAKMTREQGKALGFKLFGDERFASPSVTAFVPPAGIAADELRRTAREDYGLVVAGGQGSLRGKIIRIGHLGYVHEDDIASAMTALAHSLEHVAA